MEASATIANASEENLSTNFRYLTEAINASLQQLMSSDFVSVINQSLNLRNKESLREVANSSSEGAKFDKNLPNVGEDRMTDGEESNMTSSIGKGDVINRHEVSKLSISEKILGMDGFHVYVSCQLAMLLCLLMILAVMLYFLFVKCNRSSKHQQKFDVNLTEMNGVY